MHCYKNRHIDQWNRIEIPEINQGTYLWSANTWQGIQEYSIEKVSPINGAGMIRQSHMKSLKLYPFHTPFKKIKSKWVKWKTSTLKDICTSIFIAALFVKSKTWKQVSTDEWMNEVMVCIYIDILIKIYNEILLNYLKNQEILPFSATWMDLESIMLSEICQTKPNTVWSHLYVESKEKKKEQKTT